MSRRKHKQKPAQPSAPAGDVIELPAHERGVGPDVIAKFDYERGRLLNPIASETARKDAVRNLANLEANRERWGDRVWRDQAEAETEALAKARGEDVSRDAGRVRIISRDPLLSLARAKFLTGRQLDAAEAVRALYELRAADSSPGSFEGMPAGAHDHERFVAQRYLRAKAAVPVGQLETAILNGHYRGRDGALYTLSNWSAWKREGFEPHVSLRVMRWVCGQNQTLTSMGRGRAYDRNRAALCWALDVANEVLDSRGSGILRA